MSEDVLQQIKDYIPLLIPIILIELGLVVAALVDLIRRPKVRGPKWMWVLIIMFVNFIGPIIYFVVGREEA
jgi:hypothetical protein